MHSLDASLQGLKDLKQQRAKLFVDPGKTITIVGSLKATEFNDILNISNFYVRLTKPNCDTGLPYHKTKVC